MSQEGRLREDSKVIDAGLGVRAESHQPTPARSRYLTSVRRTRITPSTIGTPIHSAEAATSWMQPRPVMSWL